MKAVLHYIRTLSVGEHAECHDQLLLEQFLSGRNESAFAALVQRHGPMVMGVCSRILSDKHLAEDAFQATWLVLALKAGSIRKRNSLASWLHGVAARVARKLKTRTGPPQPPVAGDVEPSQNATTMAAVSKREEEELLDEELQRLPEKYRVPLLLCYFEGLTQEEAAAQLGWKAGKVKALLTRGRERLRFRLVRRGVAPSVAASATMLAEIAQSATVPQLLTVSTVRAAMKLASGTTLAACGVSGTVVTLTEGGLLAGPKRTMLILLFVLLCGSGGVGAAIWVGPGWKADVAQAPGLVAGQQERPTEGLARQPTPKETPRTQKDKEPTKDKATEKERPLPRVTIRGGETWPKDFDEALRALCSIDASVVLNALVLLEHTPVYEPPRAEVAAECEKLLNGRNGTLAHAAARTLGVWATKDQVPSLLKALDSTNSLLRQSAMEALGTTKDARAIEPVAKFLPNFGENEAAMKCLISIGPAAEEEARKYLGHSEVRGRDAAARVLRLIGKTGENDGFLKALGSVKAKGWGLSDGIKWFEENPPIANQPRHAEACKALVAIVEEADPFGGASHALVNWATTDEVPFLLARLKVRKKNSQNNKHLIRALGRLRDERAIPLLARSVPALEQIQADARKTQYGFWNNVVQEARDAVKAIEKRTMQ